MIAFSQKDERLQRHLRKNQLRSLSQKGIKSFPLEICIHCWLLIRTLVQCQGKVRTSKCFVCGRNEEEEEEEDLIVMQKSSLSSHFWPQLPMLLKVMRHLLSVMSSTTTCTLNSTPREKSLSHSLGTSSEHGIWRANRILIASLLR